ncbi:iron-sulfur cluster carrier protein ApbC [bacterium]|nr:iron-sulfur cluster carrier protein ApbC [bacterium]
MTLTVSELRDALSQLDDPYLQTNWLSAGAVAAVQAEPTPQVQLQLGFPAARYAPDVAQRVAESLQATLGQPVAVNVDWAIASHAVQQKLTPMPQVKNIIAVASGKGGVGKSTVTANLALALAGEGARVGVLDADIYGPSQPRMLGCRQRPSSPDGKSMLPLEAHGLQTMSIGYLVDEAEPTIWRGPMVTQALMQLLSETRWDNLDYLLVDLPPGTGDTQLSLVQRIPVSGAIIVTTPQDIALLDARKGLEMFKKVHVPVLGIVENMAMHTCSNCGHIEHIFGEGGGQRLAAETGSHVLGSLPLDASIRAHADGGRPSVVAEPDGDVARAYIDIARRATARLASRVVGQGFAFPTITVLDD